MLLTIALGGSSTSWAKFSIPTTGRVVVYYIAPIVAAIGLWAPHRFVSLNSYPIRATHHFPTHILSQPVAARARNAAFSGGQRHASLEVLHHALAAEVLTHCHAPFPCFRSLPVCRIFYGCRGELVPRIVRSKVIVPARPDPFIPPLPQITMSLGSMALHTLEISTHLCCTCNCCGNVNEEGSSERDNRLPGWTEGGMGVVDSISESQGRKQTALVSNVP